MTSSELTETATDAATTSTPRPRASQLVGGWAFLVAALSYVVGLAVAAAYLAPAGFTDAQHDPAALLVFLLDHQAAALYACYLVLYLVAGAALVVLVLGIHDRLADRTPTLARTTTRDGRCPPPVKSTQKRAKRRRRPSR